LIGVAIAPSTLRLSGEKIVVKNPVVELDGDEMTRIIWKKIREEVLYHPLFLDAELTLAPCATIYSSFFLICNSISSILTSVSSTAMQYAAMPRHLCSHMLTMT
jgi:hypothetical protein